MRQRSEQAPSSTPAVRRCARTLSSLAILDRAEALDLLENILQHVLSFDNIQMSSDLGVLASESLHVGRGEITTQTSLKFAWEEVLELFEKLRVQEEVGSCGQLVGHRVEEHLWTVVFALFLAALTRFDGFDPKFKDVGSVP